MGLMYIVFSILCYLFPSAVAYGRKHNNFKAIFALNVLLGWSGIAWVVALVWSLTDNISKEIKPEKKESEDSPLDLEEKKAE
ncbi:MAG TPA: hypothetical protein DCL21_06900 [Alphaproteobacteria bacterium]|nr:hypothetical protein [Alphaproteobacteria bacterium]